MNLLFPLLLVNHHYGFIHLLQVQYLLRLTAWLTLPRPANPISHLAVPPSVLQAGHDLAVHGPGRQRRLFLFFIFLAQFYTFSAIAEASGLDPLWNPSSRIEQKAGLASGKVRRGSV